MRISVRDIYGALSDSILDGYRAYFFLAAIILPLEMIEYILPRNPKMAFDLFLLVVSVPAYLEISRAIVDGRPLKFRMYLIAFDRPGYLRRLVPYYLTLLSMYFGIVIVGVLLGFGLGEYYKWPDSPDAFFNEAGFRVVIASVPLIIYRVGYEFLHVFLPSVLMFQGFNWRESLRMSFWPFFGSPGLWLLIGFSMAQALPTIWKCYEARQACEAFSSDMYKILAAVSAPFFVTFYFRVYRLVFSRQSEDPSG